MLFQGKPADLIAYSGSQRSHCGYCGGQETSHTFGTWAHALSVETYKALLDVGWRRSGKYLYKPNVVASCCQLYTIKLDAAAFRPNKQQRAALRRFNRHVLGEEAAVQTESLEEAVHCAEQSPRFSVTLEPSSYSDEKYLLYKTYQMAIHHDPEAKVSKSGFKNFLCETPLHATDGNGSFHQCYRLDGRLIALAVLDLLPGCVSSVYFIYEPTLSKLSLGRVSACREASLARQTPFGDYYMGYYIPDCVKMKYKGEYAPSFLKDPVSLQWHPLEQFAEAFKQGETLVSVQKKLAKWQGPPGTVWQEQMPGILSQEQCQALLPSMARVWIYEEGVVPLMHSASCQDEKRMTRLLEMLATMGQDVLLKDSFIASLEL